MNRLTSYFTGFSNSGCLQALHLWDHLDGILAQVGRVLLVGLEKLEEGLPVLHRQLNQPLLEAHDVELHHLFHFVSVIMSHLHVVRVHECTPCPLTTSSETKRQPKDGVVLEVVVSHMAVLDLHALKHQANMSDWDASYFAHFRLQAVDRVLLLGDDSDRLLSVRHSDTHQHILIL